MTNAGGATITTVIGVTQTQGGGSGGIPSKTTTAAPGSTSLVPGSAGMLNVPVVAVFALGAAQVLYALQ
jgi:hypothetical protein